MNTIFINVIIIKFLSSEFNISYFQHVDNKLLYYEYRGIDIIVDILFYI